MHKGYLAVALLGTVTVLLYYNVSVPKSRYLPNSQKKSFIHRDFSRSRLAEKPACEIPDIDPLDKRYRHLVLPGRIVRCGDFLPLTYQKGSYIYVNKTAVRLLASNRTFSFCQYDVVSRPRSKRDHNYFKYVNVSVPFTSSVKVKGEFVRVRCYEKKNNTIHTNFYAFVFQKQERSSRDRKYKGRKGDKPNVLMLGLDSVSRWNSVRYLTKTRKFLESLHATEMKGYTILGDNTFKNIVPMLSGKTETELGWNRSKWWIPFDQYDFIWKDFKQGGYVTFYAEDAADVAIFDYGKVGFTQFPTDFFNRHFSVAIADERRKKNIHPFCIGDRTEADVILDYHAQFLRRYEAEATFSFIFLTQITHDYPGYAASIDGIMSRYLEEIHRNGYLDNTFLFVFSDHGMRWGHLRTSEIGSTEMKLPMLFVLPPSTYRVEFTKILSGNSVRLSTPYDVYETLNAVLGFSRKSRFGANLLSSLPANRTCKQAGIPDDCCVCRMRGKIPVTNALRRLVERTVLPEINRILQPYSMKCHNLKLKRISSIFIITNENFSRSFEVVFTTKPGSALFQAEIRNVNKTSNFEITGDISRINKYGDQSNCIQDYYVKNFCFCRDI